ncbi:PAS domain S-box protein [candidate division KSB1 bacterium]
MGKPSYEDLRKRNQDNKNREEEYKKSEGLVRNRVEFIELISIISTTFINLKSEEIDENIINALELVGIFTDVDRGYVYLFSEDGKKMSNTHEWCADGIESKIKESQEIPLKEYRWLKKKVKNLEIINIPDISEFNAKADAEKKMFKFREVQSVIIIPILYNDCFLGFLGFDVINSKKVWIEEDISLLKILRNIFVNTLEYKCSEEKLRSSEERLNILFEYAPDAYYISDLKGNFIDGNKAAEEITGYKKEELIGKSFLKLKMLPSEYIPKAAKLLSLNAIGKPTGPDEFKLNRKDGNRISLEISTYPVKINNNRLVLSLARDITKRKYEEEEIKHRTELVELISVISAAFINLPSEETDEAIINALELVGKFSNVDRSYMFLFTKDKTKIEKTYEWYSEGIEKMGKKVQGLPIDLIPWWMKRLHKFEHIHITDTSTLPKIAHGDKGILLSEDVKSFVVVPVIYGNDLMGFLGLDCVHAQKQWRDENIALFKITGNIFVEALERKYAEEALRESEGELRKHRNYLEEMVQDRTARLTRINEKLELEIFERKRMEKELRESENQYRLLADNITDMIFILDLNLKITYFSPSIRRLLGYSVEEGLSKKVEELLTPASMGIAIKILNEEMSVERKRKKDLLRSRIADLEYVRKDGTTVWCEIKVTFLRDKTNRAVGIIGVARDISGRKKAQTALTKSEESLQDFLDNANDLIQSIAPDGRFLFVNKVWRKVLGYTENELSRLTISDIIHPDSRSKCLKIFKRVISGEKIGRVEAKFISKNGKVIIVEGDVNCRFENGEPVATRGIFRDITDRKKAEKEIRESETKYRELADSIDDIFFALDENLKYAYRNKAAEKMTGVVSKDIIGKSPVDVFPDDEYTKRAMNIYRRVLKTKRSENFVNRCKIKGKDSFLEISVYPSKSGVSVFIKDVTKRKEAEEALRKSEEVIRAQFRGIPVPTFTWQWVENDFILTDYNDSAAKITKGKVIDFLGKKASEMYKDNPGIKRDMVRCIKKKAVIKKDMQYKYITKKEIKHLSVTYAFVPPDIVMVHTEDITKRKKAEKALIDSEAKYKDLAELLPQPVFEIDKEGNFTFVNDIGFENYGYTKEDISKGIKAFDLLIPDDRVRARKNMRSVMMGKKSSGNEYTALKKDGSTIPVIVYSSPVIKEKETTGLRGVVIDLSQIKKAQEELKRAYSAIEASLNAIFASDLDGNVTYTNTEASKLWGYKNPAEMIGTHVLDYWAKESRGLAKEIINILTKKGFYSGKGLIGRKRDGTEFPVEAKSALIKDNDGNPIGMVSSFSGLNKDDKNKKGN